MQGTHQTEKIGELIIEIQAKAGEKGKIFGTITALQIADALKSKGFDLDRKHVNFKTPINPRLSSFQNI